MTDLTLYGRRVETVFELLGEAEDDITYSVGWGLAQSGDFARALLAEVYGTNVPTGDLTAVRLQEMEKEVLGGERKRHIAESDRALTRHAFGAPSRPAPDGLMQWGAAARGGCVDDYVMAAVGGRSVER
jgi:hypothetical protein